MINNGYVFGSVADVMFFNSSTGAYLGEGFALTDSGISSEIQNAAQRGGYQNGLLERMAHSRDLTVEFKSATFKLEYLSFLTGSTITTGAKNVYVFEENVKFTSGVGSVTNTPVGNVYVRNADGTVSTVTPTVKSVNLGNSYSGDKSVSYLYSTSVQEVSINTKVQPMTVKAVLKVKYFQDGAEAGELQIIIPKLKFDGTLNLSLTADSLKGMDFKATALEYAITPVTRGYATYDFIPVDASALTSFTSIMAAPNAYTFSLAGTTTATASIYGIRGGIYDNVLLDNADVTFVSGTPAKATVDSAGLITGVGEGTSVITVTYQGNQDVINVTVNA